MILKFEQCGSTLEKRAQKMQMEWQTVCSSRSSLILVYTSCPGLSFRKLRIRRLICLFVVRIWHKQVFSWRGSLKSGEIIQYYPVVSHAWYHPLNRVDVDRWTDKQIKTWTLILCHGNENGTLIDVQSHLSNPASLWNEEFGRSRQLAGIEIYIVWVGKSYVLPWYIWQYWFLSIKCKFKLGWSVLLFYRLLLQNVYL